MCLGGCEEVEMVGAATLMRGPGAIIQVVRVSQGVDSTPSQALTVIMHGRETAKQTMDWKCLSEEEQKQIEEQYR